MHDVMRAECGEPLPDGIHYPEWVIRCGKKVCPALFPKVYELKNSLDLSDPGKLGLLDGLLKGAETQLLKACAQVPDFEVTPEAAARGEQEIANLLYGRDSGLKLPEDGQSFIPEEIGREIETNAAGLGSEGQGQYFQGKSEAYFMLAGRNASTLATDLYLAMLLFWRLVERMSSVEQLHEFLTRRLGQNVVGSDIKRTRQLCGRIGKRFAPPGRPKKLPHAPKPAK